MHDNRNNNQPEAAAKAPPVILQIVPALETGGAELSALEIAEAVTRAGGHALVASTGGRLVPRLVAAGAVFVPFPAATKNPAAMLWNVARLRRLVLREGVDLIHARSRAPAWSALLAARWTGRPFVTTYHGAYSEQNRLKNFYNSIMARGDVVIANSRYTADLISARYGTPEERLRVIYRGVASAFDPGQVSPSRVAALRRRWGVSATRRVVLHAARLTPWKGQADVIAAADLLRHHPDTPLFILAGDAQGRERYAERLVRQIDALGLTGTVKLVGHCDDMPAAFALAHVAVVASAEPEAFGRAAAEAQAMGCPVISTDIGAPPETVLAPPRTAPGEATGWLVPPADPEALARALIRALALPPDERERMSTRARAHVRAAFSIEAMQQATLAVYDGLLGTNLAARFAAERQKLSGPDKDSIS